jgi:hypothetical protein
MDNPNPRKKDPAAVCLVISAKKLDDVLTQILPCICLYLIQQMTEADEALLMAYGTPEERKAVTRTCLRKEKKCQSAMIIICRSPCVFDLTLFNHFLQPKAVVQSPLQLAALKIRNSCLEHAHGSSEGLTFVNPDNKSQFMQISHKRQWIWAMAIVNSQAGVDDTHPPTGHEFEWESCAANIPSMAGTTATQAIRIEDLSQPSSFQPAHIGKSNSSTRPGSDVSVVAPSPVTSQYKHH